MYFDKQGFVGEGTNLSAPSGHLPLKGEARLPPVIVTFLAPLPGELSAKLTERSYPVTPVYFNLPVRTEQPTLFICYTA